MVGFNRTLGVFMKAFITIAATVFLFGGCASKIVPGHAEQKAEHISLESLEKESKKEVVQPPVLKTEETELNITVETNETQPLMQEIEVVEEVAEEEPKNRFPRSEFISSHPYKITMKTKKFAFSDTGFLNKYDNLLNLEVFTMGKLALDLRISLEEDDICVDQLCNTKEGFNQTFLSPFYPDDLIEKVIQRKPILGGKNLKKTSNGFMQKIMTKDYSIKYKIWPGNIYFKDAKNKIMIKLKRLPDE